MCGAARHHGCCARAAARAIAKAETEELAHRALSEEEVALRQRKLAKLRALLFYEEQKRRRSNAIKVRARAGALAGLSL